MTYSHLFLFVNMDAKIKELLRAGKTIKQINIETGKSLSYIQSIRKSMIESKELSEEEIEKAREESKRQSFISDPNNQKILKYARQGLSQNDIAYEVGSNQITISRILKIFKNYGVLTQEEIDEARARYNQEVKYDDFRRDLAVKALEAGRLKSDFAHEIGVTERGAKVIQDSLIEEGRITQEQIDQAVATKGKEVLRRQKIIELLKQGYLYQEISEMDGYCPTTIRRIKEKAIKEGVFTEEDYQVARLQRVSERKKQPKKSKGEDKELENAILDMLSRGKDMFYMRRKTGKTKKDIQDLIQKVMKDGKISNAQIREAREKAKQELERRVLIGLKKGETQREIVDSFGDGEYTLTAIQTAISHLKESGKITDEDIARYKYEAEQGEKALQAFILRGIRLGLSRVEMAKRDETGYFSESKIKHAIRRMRKQGLISQKDIKKGKSARKKDIQDKARQKSKVLYAAVLKLAKQGYTAQEIADELGYKRETIWLKIADLKKQGKITQEDIDRERSNRKGKKEMQENENYSKYRKILSKARNLYEVYYGFPDDRINKTVREWIDSAKPILMDNIIKPEDFKFILDFLLCSAKPAIANILGITQLQVKMSNHQGAVYTLNYSRSFFEKEEDLKVIDDALGAISLYRRKTEAINMLHQQCPIDVIQKRTKLGTAEIIALQNKEDKIQGQKDIEIVFPEIPGEE